MPKKVYTEEERKAIGERLRKGREAKVEEVKVETPPAQEVITNEDLQHLLKRIAELERGAQFKSPQAQVTSKGLIGTFEKYNVDPKLYPDPRLRLADEPRLKRFAFDVNYELGFEVSTTSYTTQDGINTKEPKFDIELYKIVMDEDGEPTTGRYVIRRATFHEDPQAALAIAREHGLQVDESNEADFLNEMRYLRFRDWLIEAFYPPKNDVSKSNKKEMVVGGKLVEYFEKSGVESQSIDFGQLKGKV